MTQESIHKLLKSIYKAERAKKKKEKENESKDGNDDDDSDDEDTAKAEPERWEEILYLTIICLNGFENYFLNLVESIIFQPYAQTEEHSMH